MTLVAILAAATATATSIAFPPGPVRPSGDTNRFEELAFSGMAEAPRKAFDTYAYTVASPAFGMVWADFGVAESLDDTLEIVFSRPVVSACFRIWTVGDAGYSNGGTVRVSAGGQSATTLGGPVAVTGSFDRVTLTASSGYVALDDLVTTDAQPSVAVARTGGGVKATATARPGAAVTLLASDSPDGPWAALATGDRSVAAQDSMVSQRFYRATLGRVTP